MFIEQKDMIGQYYINSTREYCNYLEEHLNNVRKAFQELSEACKGMAWVEIDSHWHALRTEVCNHDLSKFSMYEFTQYRDKFFPVSNSNRVVDKAFNNAWKHHYECNSHHSEYISNMDPFLKDKFPGVIERYLIHMVIDWTAMGYKFGDTPRKYYELNTDKHNLTDTEINFIYILFDKLEEYREQHKP